jgi:pimeloyl-ACP methyl ester carboxylesterase
MQTRILCSGAGSAAHPQAPRLVLLPGAYQRPEDFVRAGFERSLRERAPTAELILAAPQLAHLTDRSWLAQLRSEVIEPARARAGGALWLGGVSLGAFMALRFAAEDDALIDGLCLLAPYLGSRLIAAEIAALPDLASWQPGPLAADDDERRIWRYVLGLAASGSEPQSAPRVFLGFGRDDRFADTQHLLGRCLRGHAPCIVPGAHDWPVWLRLWESFLADGLRR